MQSIRNSFGSLAIIGGLIGSLNFVHAQTATVGSFNGNIMQVQPAQGDSIVNIVAEAQGLQLMSPEEVPISGTFWWVMPGGAAVPAPCPPLDLSAPIYQIADGQFLVGETGGQVAVNTRRLGPQAQATSSTAAAVVAAQADAVVNLITQVQTTAANQQMRTMAMASSMTALDTSGPPSPGDGDSGDSGTNSFTPEGSGYPVDFGTNLWIANFALSQGSAVGIVSNTAADISYEIQYKNDLTSTQWLSTGFFILGSELTNWTAMSIPGVSLTNNAFFRIRSWEDDGSGLPIWWQMQYFGTTGVDPYGDPDGDGWNNLAEFQNGTDPLGFNLPPAPQGLTATYNADNTATVSWLPSPGPVTGYTVQRYYYTFSGSGGGGSQTFNVTADTVRLHDTTPFTIPYAMNYYGLGVMVSYQIQAHYAGGDSAWSDTIWLESKPIWAGSNPQDITLVGGPQGSVYVAARNLPAGTTALRLTRVDEWMEDEFGDSPANAVSFYIPLSTGTNGLYLIPAEDTTSPLDAYGYAWYSWFVQPVNANGQGTSQANRFDWGFYSDLLPQYWIVPPYFDGRAQLKQNLIFLLRAATVDSPFYYNGFGTNQVYTSCFYAYTVTNPATYAYSAFNSPFGIVVNYSGGYGYIQNGFDVFSPFQNNYLYRNFVFNMADLSGYRPPFYSEIPGHIMTGVAGSYEDTGFFYSHHGLGLVDLPTYHFMPPTTSGVTIPAMLATNQTQWLCSYPLDSPEMYYDPATDSMVSYGYLEETGVTPSVDAGWNQWESMAANARNIYGLRFLSAKIAWGNTSDATYPLSGGSQVENVDGYFYPQTAQPLFQAVEYDFWNRSPLPGSTNFATSQASDLLIAGVDSSIGVNGYAKLAVTNGYSGVYAYLGQYFDQAYTEDANGNATTNTTGVLSPYGNFFATQPGPAALVTMPDVDTGERGTCKVNCFSVQVDKNSDGNMDLSFSGPDATSQASPYKVWVNSGHCEPGKNGNLDTDLPVPPNLPNYSQGEITCQRDLENFFRLWVCGLPMLPANQGYTVTLSMSPVSGSPAINLYDSVETNGGTGYLTDTNIAAQQCLAYAHGSSPYNIYYTGPGAPIAKITPSSSFTFPASYFTNSGNKYFLFEGACTNGSGELLLTVSQNGNTIGQTGVWLDLHDITDFYEQADATNVPSGKPPSSLVSQYSVTHTSSGMGNETKQVIVYVHGINNTPWDYEDTSQTIFKRLYWSGYHGRFAAFRWTCGYFPLNSGLNVYEFNESEFWAYKSATAFKNYLSYLKNRPDLTGYAIDIFAHSQGNAVVSEALSKGATCDNYILTQGAVPAHCYDGSAPTLQVLLDAETSTLNGATGVPTPFAASIGGYNQCWTNISGNVGNMVNFFNTNDFALVSGSYGPFDANWVKNQQSQKPESFAGGPSYIYYPATQTSIANFLFGIGNYTVTDWEESRSMVARSRTSAIGAQGPASGQTRQGIISSSVDLKASFEFGNSRDEHSAQFTRPIQTSLPYYQQVLRSFNIPIQQ